MKILVVMLVSITTLCMSVYIGLWATRAKTPQELGRLNEPMRTYWYMGCLQGGITMTTCGCVERSVIKKMGSSPFYTQNVTRDDIKRFLNECQNGSEGQAIKREMQEAMFEDSGETM